MITLNAHDEANDGYHAGGQVSENDNVRIEYSGYNDCNESIQEDNAEYHEFGEWRILFNRFILWLSFRMYDTIIRCTDSMIIVLSHGFYDFLSI